VNGQEKHATMRFVNRDVHAGRAQDWILPLPSILFLMKQVTSL